MQLSSQYITIGAIGVSYIIHYFHAANSYAVIFLISLESYIFYE